ncbi:MAG TPA: DMT family transporter [Burkholderiales bacterium]|nr:DMT family transporter [Burkholderiales bacterium]
MTGHRVFPYLVLACGVVVVSTAAILVRLAQAEGASSISIAAGRLAIAAIVLAPLVWARVGAELRRLSARELLLPAASGILLALHFWTWIASLEYTSVASSTVLVTTNPLWVAIASALLLRERPGAATIAGIALTVFGSGLIFVSDTGRADAGAAPALGNSLALAGALAASGYLLIGRALRGRISLLAYVWLAYSAAAVTLVVAAVATGQGVGELTPNAWWFIIALALGPQLLGHTAFNWALRRLTATFVAVAILGEPVGSAALAWLMLGERFGVLQFVGFVLLLAGIFLAARSERST